MAKVHLHMTGLCLFAPDDNKNEMRVLLLGEQSSKPLDVHVPVLFFEMRSLLHDPYECEPTTRAADLAFWDPLALRNPKRMGLCFLEGYELSISGAEEDNLSVEDGDLDGPCPNPANRNYFSWVASLSKIQSEPKTVKESFFGTPCDDPILGSRLLLTDGALRVEDLVGNQDHTVRLDFRKPGEQDLTGNARAVGEVIELRTDLEDEKPLIIELAPLRGGQNPELSLLPLCLRPLEVEGEEQQVHVWIKTIPIVDILGQRPSKGLPDFHFANFYRFWDWEDPSDFKTEDLVIPHPEADCWGPATHSNPRCSCGCV